MKTYTYKYPKPSVTTDCILINSSGEKKEILLIKRKNEPFTGKWALPGGFVEIDEDLEEGARRELIEETSIEEIDLYQFKTYGKPGRDPRGRTISVVYFGILDRTKTKISAGDDASDVGWFDINQLPTMAFDHNKIINEFIKAQLMDSLVFR